MKSITPARLACFAAFLCVLSVGCRKRLCGPPPSDPASLCKVEYITTLAEGANGSSLYPDTLHFSYNNHGNLSTISRLHTSDIGYHNYTIWYDAQQRVTDVIETGSLPVTTGNTYRTWHKLYYTNGKITLDSLFDYGVVNGHRPDSHGGGVAGLIYVSNFVYDDSGRIKHATDVSPGTYVWSQDFRYAGNYELAWVTQVSGYITTPTSDTVVGIFPIGDSMVNVNRTVPILQFLNRNYSVHNQFFADAYNEEGLPTVIPQQGQPYLGHLPQFGEFGFLKLMDPITIHYNCEVSGPPPTHGY